MHHKAGEVFCSGYGWNEHRVSSVDAHKGIRKGLVATIGLAISRVVHTSHCIANTGAAHIIKKKYILSDSNTF